MALQHVLDGPGLGGLRVVEIAGSAAGGYAARLFAGWGAHVVSLTPTDGAPDGPPAPDDACDRYLRHATRTGRADDAAIAAAVASADVVIESAAPGPLHARTHPRPGLVRIEISPLGRGGPDGGRPSTELTDIARSGHLLLNGDPDREPLAGPAHQVPFAAGLHGVIGACAALLGGVEEGVTIEVDHLRVMASLHQFTLIRHLNGGDTLRRMGNRWAGPGRPAGIYRCRDGFASTIVPRDDQLERLLAVTDGVHLLAEPGIDGAYDLMHHPTLVDDHLRPWFATQRVDDAVSLLQEVRVAAAPVSSMADVLDDEHLATRGALVSVDGVTMPGPPARISGWEWHIAPAPDPDRPRSTHPGSSTTASTRLLAGLRVVDLTRVWAGPLATRVLADLGADVVVVEAPWARGGPTIDEASVRATAYYPDNDPGEEHWNRIGFVNKYALGKRSVALDLSRPGGHTTLAALLATADVVIENYSPRVMPQLGFDEATLADLNPDLTYVTMPGYGRSGPDRDRVAYGPVIEAHAGLSTLMGYPGEQARSAGVAWPDPVAGLHAAAATLVSLLVAPSTDRGRPARVVEVAQIEATVAMVGAQMVAAQLGGAQSAATAAGNRHHHWSPQMVTPCRGDDAWVALTVLDDAGWQALASVIGRDGWAALTRQDRHDRADEIEAAIADWSRGHEPRAVTEALAHRAIASAVVATARDVIDDPQLAALDAWSTTRHPAAGPETWLRTAITVNGGPLEPSRPAPLLGEHNALVVTEAGVSGADYAELVDDGTLCTRPPD